MPAPTLGQSQRSWSPRQLAALASSPTAFLKVPLLQSHSPPAFPGKARQMPTPGTLQITAQSHVFPGLCSHVASSSDLPRAPLRGTATRHCTAHLLRHCTPHLAARSPGAFVNTDQSPHSLSILFAQWNGASRGPGPCRPCSLPRTVPGTQWTLRQPLLQEQQASPLCTDVATIWLSWSSSFPTRQSPAHCHSAVERRLSLEHRESDFNPAPRLFSRPHLLQRCEDALSSRPKATGKGRWAEGELLHHAPASRHTCLMPRWEQRDPFWMPLSR